MQLKSVLYQVSVSELTGEGKQQASSQSSGYHMGLRAEEVRSVVPEVVYTSQEGEAGGLITNW